jgi:hypothetical protein
MSNHCEPYKEKVDAMISAQLEEHRNRLSQQVGIVGPGKAMQVDAKALDEWACFKAYMHERE